MSVLKGLQNLLIKMGGTPVSGDNTDETVQKIADAYDPNGGGSSLPEYTNDDINKCLSLQPTGEVVSKTINVVNEQTVTTGSHGDGHLADETYDFSDISIGDEVILTIDGVSETVVAQAGNRPGVRVLESSDPRNITIASNGNAESNGPYTFTVSVTAVKNIPVIAPNWYCGIDIVYLSTEYEDPDIYNITSCSKYAKEIFNEITNGSMIFASIYIDGYGNFFIPCYKIDEDPMSGKIIMFNIIMSDGSYFDLAIGEDINNSFLYYGTISGK